MYDYPLIRLINLPNLKGIQASLIKHWHSELYLKQQSQLGAGKLLTGGELGIRTPGPVTVNSFQDCRNRPLCQLSGAKVRYQPIHPKKKRNNLL